MRINELILESKQLDELSLAGIGQGIGKVASGVGKAVGGVQGAFHGAKDAYRQGKAGAYAPTRDAVAQGAPATNQAPKGAVQSTPAQQQSQDANGNAPGQPNTGGGLTPPTTPEERAAHMAAGGKFDDQTGKPIPLDNTQSPNQQTQSNTQSNQQQQTPQATAMKAGEIAGELKSTWDKATSDQGSMTSSPQVQQQIIAMAKAAGLTGTKIESVGYSRFLGIAL